MKRRAFGFVTVRLNKERSPSLCYVRRPVTCTTAVQFWSIVTRHRHFFVYAVIER